MMNPLVKRLPREFKSEFGKYTVIFLFMVMLISLVSGFFVTSSSMLAAYDESFEKYNIEHGHITFDKQPADELIDKIEEKADIKLYDLRYFDEEVFDGKTLRIYTDRETVNKECIMSGEMPSADNEAAIDRMFADNNGIKIGDTVNVKGKELKVTGFVALSDYNSLYKSNTDMMLDAIGFGVGIVTKSGFESFADARIRWNYAWKYNCDYDRNDKVRANELSEDFIDVLEDVIREYDEGIVKAQTDELKNKLEKAGEEYAGLYMSAGKAPSRDTLTVPVSGFLFGIIEDSFAAQMKGEEYSMPAEEEFESEIDKSEIIGIEDYVPQYVNKAICFAGTDLGGDRGTFVLFSYIVTAVLAFIFAVTTSGTIAAEAGVIGTLRASGYSRSELIRHYLTLPVLVTFIAAVVGNILGYTYFRGLMEDLEYGTYSLPTYEVQWNADAFIITTVIPVILMLLINFLIISSKLKLSPLQFLRRELKKNPKKKAFRLNTKIPFSLRFRLRIIFQNMANYAVMIFGIILGAMIIIFGELFGTLFDDYSELMMDSIICDYQYVLTDTVSTENEQAEKYSMTSLDFQYKDYMKDEISIYGIENDSLYVKAETAENKTAISNTVAEKYSLEVGDEITFSDPYSNNKTYTFTVDSIYDYDAGLAVFISRESFNDNFEKGADYFTGYFSNEKLDDIDDSDVAAIITINDFTKVSAQMKRSVGGIMKFFGYFGIVMFVLIMYILSKQIIDKNFQSISMCKILGFKNGEIGSLYIVSTSVAVIAGLIAAIPLTDILLRWAFNYYLYKMVTGYFPYIIRSESFVKMIIIGVISYAVVAAFQLLKINRIPKGEAIKNRE